MLPSKIGFPDKTGESGCAPSVVINGVSPLKSIFLLLYWLVIYVLTGNSLKVISSLQSLGANSNKGLTDDFLNKVGVDDFLALV
jgi:hypothetical protein